MPGGSSPGLRAAIGFLRLFSFIAGLFYAGGIVISAGWCLMAVDLRNDARAGVVHVGGLLLVVAGLTGLYALRTGAWVMAGIFENRDSGLSDAGQDPMRRWGRGLASFFVGVAAALLSLQGCIAAWLLSKGGSREVFLAVAVASWILAVAGWSSFPWVWKRQNS